MVALPLDAAPLPQWTVAKLGERAATTAGDFDWHRPAKPTRYVIEPAYFDRVLHETAGDRSAALARPINHCLMSGWSAEETYEALALYEDAPVMTHYPENNFDKALRADIKRLFIKQNPNDPEVKFKAAIDAWLADHPQATEEEKAAHAETLKPGNKFKHVLPSAAMKRTPPSYWDPDELFIHIPGGSRSIISAKYSNFKTTFAACRMIAICKRHEAARVLYAVQEGAGGFGPMTLQAAMKDWNDHHADKITLEWLDAHLHLIEQPLRILNEADIAALIESCADFHPTHLVIDPLGAAAAGSNLAAIEVGTAIGAAFQTLVQTLKCDGVLVHHLGKNEDAGPTGSQYICNDPDVGLILHHDAAVQALVVTVDKNRWGKKDRILRYGTRVVAGLRSEGTTDEHEFVAVYDLALGDVKQRAPAKPVKPDKKAIAQAHASRRVLEALRNRAQERGDGPAELDAVVDYLMQAQPGDGFKSNRRDSIAQWVRSQIRNLNLARLMVCDVESGEPLRAPYTFKPWAEIAYLHNEEAA